MDGGSVRRRYCEAGIPWGRGTLGRGQCGAEVLFGGVLWTGGALVRGNVGRGYFNEG